MVSPAVCGAATGVMKRALTFAGIEGVFTTGIVKGGFDCYWCRRCVGSY